MATKRWLRSVGRIHKLLSVLADPKMRCSGKSCRAVSRLFLDMNSADVLAAVRHAERLGLVVVKFHNPYFIGRGENFISLTERGDRCVGG